MSNSPGWWADRHRNRLIVGIRGATEALRDEARRKARQNGYTGLSDLTVQFWQWYLGRPGAKLPVPPEKEQDGAKQAS